MYTHACTHRPLLLWLFLPLLSPTKTNKVIIQVPSEKVRCLTGVTLVTISEVLWTCFHSSHVMCRRWSLLKYKQASRVETKGRLITGIKTNKIKIWWQTKTTHGRRCSSANSWFHSGFLCGTFFRCSLTVQRHLSFSGTPCDWCTCAFYPMGGRTGPHDPGWLSNEGAR